VLCTRSGPRIRHSAFKNSMPESEHRSRRPRAPDPRALRDAPRRRSRAPRRARDTLDGQTRPKRTPRAQMTIGLIVLAAAAFSGTCGGLLGHHIPLIYDQLSIPAADVALYEDLKSINLVSDEMGNNFSVDEFRQARTADGEEFKAEIKDWDAKGAPENHRVARRAAASSVLWRTPPRRASRNDGERTHTSLSGTGRAVAAVRVSAEVATRFRDAVQHFGPAGDAGLQDPRRKPDRTRQRARG